jgi:hypothetical protein
MSTSSASAPSCHLSSSETCSNPGVQTFLINDVHTCAACLADAVERVANGDLEYPVTINNSDIDLDAYAQFLDLSLLESYASRKLEHTTHPDDRVHCKCERFIGVKLAPSTIASATTIGQCLSCDGAACMTCTTQLDKDSKLSKALDHGCKEKLEAPEKQRLSFVNGTDRGKGYQICPFCQARRLPPRRMSPHRPRMRWRVPLPLRQAGEGTQWPLGEPPWPVSAISHGSPGTRRRCSSRRWPG